VPDANELKLLASRQEQAFHEKFGYPAREIPNIWVGQRVAINTQSPPWVIGMLEAVKPDGYVLSVGDDDSIIFIPRESVLRLALYNPDLHLGKDEPEIIVQQVRDSLLSA
jgi:hypothetical protein